MQLTVLRTYDSMQQQRRKEVSMLQGERYVHSNVDTRGEKAGTVGFSNGTRRKRDSML